MSAPRLRRIAALALPFVTTLTYAAHPLISEDTGTQGTGNFELELGTGTSHVQGGDRILELDPQLSFGALDNLDLILRPSYLLLTGNAADAAGRHHGFGTTALDFKWRAPGDGPWTFGFRGCFDLPTSQGDIAAHELGDHVLAMVTYLEAPLMATANVAYTHLSHDAGPGARRDFVRLSAGGLYNVTDVLRLAGDFAIAQSPDASERGWPAVGLVGAILTLPWGFDVDAGYQFALNRRAPSGVWLLGATLRW